MIVSARTVLITDAPFSNQLYGTRPTRILCMSVPTSYLSAAIIASAIGPAEGGFWPVKRLPAVQTLGWKTPPSLKIPPFSDMRSSHEPGPLGLEQRHTVDLDVGKDDRTMADGPNRLARTVDRLNERLRLAALGKVPHDTKATRKENGVVRGRIAVCKLLGRFGGRLELR